MQNNKATKLAFGSQEMKNDYRLVVFELDGGDDRIRTCGTLLEYNGLANRRFQPLSHVSEKLPTPGEPASGKN